MVDSISIEVLDDGTIKILTEGVSSANHRNAEDFLAFMSKLAGGKTETTKRKQGHAHGHEHTHEHIKH